MVQGKRIAIVGGGSAGLGALVRLLSRQLSNTSDSVNSLVSFLIQTTGRHRIATGGG